MLSRRTSKRGSVRAITTTLAAALHPRAEKRRRTRRKGRDEERKPHRKWYELAEQTNRPRRSFLEAGMLRSVLFRVVSGPAGPFRWCWVRSKWLQEKVGEAPTLHSIQHRLLVDGAFLVGRHVMAFVCSNFRAKYEWQDVHPAFRHGTDIWQPRYDGPGWKPELVI